MQDAPKDLINSFWGRKEALLYQIYPLLVRSIIILEKGNVQN
jgi:hypothetical protein